MVYEVAGLRQAEGVADRDLRANFTALGREVLPPRNLADTILL